MRVYENGFTLVDLKKDGDLDDQLIRAKFFMWTIQTMQGPRLYDNDDVCDNIEENLIVY